MGRFFEAMASAATEAGKFVSNVISKTTQSTELQGAVNEASKMVSGAGKAVGDGLRAAATTATTAAAGAHWDLMGDKILRLPAEHRSEVKSTFLTVVQALAATGATDATVALTAERILAPHLGQHLDAGMAIVEKFVKEHWAIIALIIVVLLLLSTGRLALLDLVPGFHGMRADILAFEHLLENPVFLLLFRQVAMVLFSSAFSWFLGSRASGETVDSVVTN